MRTGQKRSPRLLDFKGRPEYVLPALQAIRADGSWQAMKSKIISSLKALGARASEENLVSAYATPTLRNLNLIEGETDSVRLTPDGLQCLEAYETLSDAAYRRRLALQLLQIDARSARIIELLRDKHPTYETAADLSTIATELASRGVQGTESQTALRGWIDLFLYTGLVDRAQARFYLLPYSLEIAMKGQKEVDLDTFVRTVHVSYSQLAPRYRGSKYVPIPRIRDSVCSQLSISQGQFYDLVTQLFHLRRPGIVFSTPRGRRQGGIWIGKKYYYYIAIFGA